MHGIDDLDSEKGGREGIFRVRVRVRERWTMLVWDGQKGRLEDVGLALRIHIGVDVVRSRIR
jgi:hypothetical protein